MAMMPGRPVGKPRHLNLTDFLLARITENEAIALGLDRHKERALAECWAQRQLVQLHQEPVHCCRDDGWPCTTLRVLALPYADRPDYDESWRTSEVSLKAMTYGRHRAL